MKRLMLQHDNVTGEIHVQIQERPAFGSWHTTWNFIMDRGYTRSSQLGSLAVIHQRSLNPDWREVCQ